MYVHAFSYRHNARKSHLALLSAKDSVNLREREGDESGSTRIQYPCRFSQNACSWFIQLFYAAPLNRAPRNYSSFDPLITDDLRAIESRFQRRRCNHVLLVATANAFCGIISSLFRCNLGAVPSYVQKRQPPCSPLPLRYERSRKRD